MIKMSLSLSRICRYHLISVCAHMHMRYPRMISDANTHDETRLLSTADGGHLLTDTHTHTRAHTHRHKCILYTYHTHMCVYLWVQVDGGFHVLGARISGRRGRYDAGVMLRGDDLEDHSIPNALGAGNSKLCSAQQLSSVTFASLSSFSQGASDDHRGCGQ
jgi:hypothetical protein